MLLDALFRWFAGVLHDIYARIPHVPTADLSGYQSAAGSAFAFAKWANYYLPVDSAVAILGLILTIWVVLYGLRIADWVATKLHLLGGE